MQHKEKVVALLIVAHLINALLYLSIDKSYKYDPDLQDYFSLWFFGAEYSFIAAISYFRPKKFWLDVFVSHLGTRAILYIGYFSDLYTDNIVMRLGFMMILLFILSVTRLYRDDQRSIC